MKNLVLCLITAIFLIGCSNSSETEKQLPRKERMKISAISAVKPTMKDPASFEFVSLSVTDSATVGERKEIVNEEELKKVMEFTLPEADELKQQVQLEYDFLKNQTQEDKIAVYFIDMQAKGTNSFGGVIQNTFRLTLLNDSSFTVAKVD